MARRSHAKTRSGCATCKARRIKCKEERPECRNVSSPSLKTSECADEGSVSSMVSPVLAIPKFSEIRPGVGRLEGIAMPFHTSKDRETILTTPRLPIPSLWRSSNLCPSHSLVRNLQILSSWFVSQMFAENHQTMTLNLTGLFLGLVLQEVLLTAWRLGEVGQLAGRHKKISAMAIHTIVATLSRTNRKCIISSMPCY